MHTLGQLKTDLSGCQDKVCQQVAAKERAHHIVSDLPEPRIVWRRSRKWHGKANGEKDAGQEIHQRLVSDEGVDTAAEMSTSKDQNHNNHSISTHASHTGNESKYQGSEFRCRRLRRRLKSMRYVLNTLISHKVNFFARTIHLSNCTQTTFVTLSNASLCRCIRTSRMLLSSNICTIFPAGGQCIHCVGLCDDGRLKENAQNCIINPHIGGVPKAHTYNRHPLTLLWLHSHLPVMPTFLRCMYTLTTAGDIYSEKAVIKACIIPVFSILSVLCSHQSRRRFLDWRLYTLILLDIFHCMLFVTKGLWAFLQ